MEKKYTIEDIRKILLSCSQHGDNIILKCGYCLSLDKMITFIEEGLDINRYNEYHYLYQSFQIHQDIFGEMDRLNILYREFYKTCTLNEIREFNIISPIEFIVWMQNEVVKNKNNVKRSKKPGYIYFVEDDRGCIKIGKTKNVKNRISSLQTGSSSTLKLIGYYHCEDMEEEERLNHKIYKDDRVQGEWFNLDKNALKLDLEFYNIIRCDDGDN